MTRTVYRLAALSMLLAALGACSFAPLGFSVNLLDRFPDETTGSFTFDAESVTVDLKPQLGGAATGGFSQNSPVGGITLPPIDLVLPSAAGQTLDFRDQTLPAELTAATLSYRVVLANRNLTGTLQVQPYLAPVGADDAAQEGYALGPAQPYTLGGAAAMLSADVELNEAQLAGINAKQLRLALRLSGSVSVVTAGEVSVTYTFQTLSLTIFGVTAQLDELLPNADGTVLDFSDEDISGRIVDAALVYDLTLTSSAALDGSLTAQVYLAPPGEDSLWQAKYAFGEPEQLELAQPEIPVTGRASLNDVQKPVLDQQVLRLGVRVVGTATVPLQGAIAVEYRFNNLTLEGGFALR